MKPREEWHGRNKGSAYMRWYTGDVLSDGFMASLSPVEENSYRRLMDFNHRDGSIPNDLGRLARLCKLTPDEFEPVWAVIGCKFQPLNGDNLSLYNSRIKFELDRQKKISSSNKKAGRKGGRVSKSRDIDEIPYDIDGKRTVSIRSSERLTSHKRTAGHPDPDPDPDPNKKKEKKKSAAPPPPKYRFNPEGFEGYGDFEGDATEKARMGKMLDDGYLKEFGDDWIQRVYKNMIRWCKDNPLKISAKRDHNKFVLGWYRRQADKERKGESW